MRSGWIAVVLLSCACCLAQNPVRGPKKGCQPRQQPNDRNWISRLAVSDAFTQTIGLTEKQARSLKNALAGIGRQNRALEDKIRKNAGRQVPLYRTILTRPDATGEELFDLIDEIGACRAEQAKLTVRTLLVIRDTLDEGQREKANAFIREAGRKRMAERRRKRMDDQAALCPAKRGAFPPPRAAAPGRQRQKKHDPHRSRGGRIF